MRNFEGILPNTNEIVQNEPQIVTDDYGYNPASMTEPELFRWVLIEGAIGGAVLALFAWLLSRFTKDIHGRTLLATVLFAAAGGYLGFAFAKPVSRIWLLIELLQCIAFGAMGLYGWRGPVKWLALGWWRLTSLFTIA